MSCLWAWVPWSLNEEPCLPSLRGDKQNMWAVKWSDWIQWSPLSLHCYFQTRSGSPFTFVPYTPTTPDIPVKGESLEDSHQFQWLQGRNPGITCQVLPVVKVSIFAIDLYWRQVYTRFQSPAKRLGCLWFKHCWREGLGGAGGGVGRQEGGSQSHFISLYF